MLIKTCLSQDLSNKERHASFVDFKDRKLWIMDIPTENHVQNSLQKNSTVIKFDGEDLIFTASFDFPVCDSISVCAATSAEVKQKNI